MGLLVKKRQLLTATLIIALGAAVMVNWYYGTNQNVSDSTESTYSQDITGNLGDSVLVAGTVQNEEITSDTINSTVKEYFSNAKISKENANDEIKDSIEEILKKENLTQEDKVKLENLYSEYQDTIKMQSDAENLIKAKTGSECVVIINDGTCQVIMEKNTLNDTVILQITEIIEKNTYISAENLTIIEVK